MHVRGVITIIVMLVCGYGGIASLAGALWAELQLRTNGAPKRLRVLSLSSITLFENIFFYGSGFQSYGSAHLAMKVARSGLLAFMIGCPVAVVLAFTGAR